MDAASFSWLLGELLSAIVLAAGWYLALLATEPPADWRQRLQRGPFQQAEAHEPINHRLCLEAEW